MLAPRPCASGTRSPPSRHQRRTTPLRLAAPRPSDAQYSVEHAPCDAWQPANRHTSQPMSIQHEPTYVDPTKVDQQRGAKVDRVQAARARVHDGGCLAGRREAPRRARKRRPRADAASPRGRDRSSGAGSSAGVTEAREARRRRVPRSPRATPSSRTRVTARCCSPSLRQSTT